MNKIISFDVCLAIWLYIGWKNLKVRLIEFTGTTLTTYVIQSTQGHVLIDEKFWPFYVPVQLPHQNLSISI